MHGLTERLANELAARRALRLGEVLEGVVHECLACHGPALLLEDQKLPRDLIVLTCDLAALHAGFGMALHFHDDLLRAGDGRGAGRENSEGRRGRDKGFPHGKNIGEKSCHVMGIR